jgi:hypothetical protein
MRTNAVLAAALLGGLPGCYEALFSSGSDLEDPSSYSGSSESSSYEGGEPLEVLDARSEAYAGCQARLDECLASGSSDCQEQWSSCFQAAQAIGSDGGQPPSDAEPPPVEPDTPSPTPTPNCPHGGWNGTDECSKVLPF